MGSRRPSRPLPDDPIPSLVGSPVEATLDLHGETRRSAEPRLRNFLDTWRRRRPGAVVRIVTGRGTRSRDGAVLPERVRELLHGPLADQVDTVSMEPGGGGVRVRVR
jgi:DNA-nicking Smr family endonuclease